jgi:hypothetical protein
VGTLIRGKQIGTGSNGIRAANVDTTELPTLAANNTFTGTNEFDDTLNVTGTMNVTGGGTITVPTPVAGTDAANKTYVDSVAMGIDWKQSVHMASTANLTLSGLQTVDGVVGGSGSRILVKNQSTGSENGIYNMLSGSWTRASDANSNDNVNASMAVFVEEGSTNADTGWVLTTDNPIVVGTTALVFTQFTGAGSIVAGAGLTKTGSTLDVNVDNTTIEINSDTLRIKDLGVATAKLDNLAVTTGKIAAQAVDFTKFVRGTSGTLVIAQGAGADSQYVAMSGDALITNAGVITIEALAVTTGKINNLAVTTGKLAADAVDNSKLADDAVQTENILNLAVTTGKIDNLAVTTGKLAATSVTAAKLGSDVAGNGLTGGNGSALVVLATNDSIVVSAGGVRAAVPVTTNKIITAVVTTADGDAATAGGDALASTPGGDGYVAVRINGIGVQVGDGNKTKSCYFSADGGTTARAFSAIVAGDRLYWNGSIAGYQLDTSDTIDFIYNA